MDDFECFITNKRVVLVGPSYHLEGKSLGKKIDSYDVICRLNELFPRNLEQDYGSRSDILFWHLCNADKSIFVNVANENPKMMNNVKFLVYPRQHNDVNRRGGGGRTPKKNAEEWFPGVPFYQIDTNKPKKWEQDTNAHLTVGVLAILMLLEYELKELFICGMSFYKHEGIFVNTPAYHSSHRTSFIRQGGHGIDESIPYLRKKIKHRNNVFGDSFFEELLLDVV
jgi:hypothetical protein